MFPEQQKIEQRIGVCFRREQQMPLQQIDTRKAHDVEREKPLEFLSEKSPRFTADGFRGKRPGLLINALGKQISRDDQKQFDGNPTALAEKVFSEKHIGMNQ